MILFKCQSAHVTSFKTLQWFLISEKAKALTRACKSLSNLSYFSNLSPTIFHSLSFLQPYTCASWRHTNTLAPQDLCIWASLVAQLVENTPAMWETWVRSLGWEDPLEKGMATSLPWNSMDYIVHGVQKSWTRLSDFHFHFLSGYVFPQIFKWHIPSLLSGLCSDPILLERLSMTT